MKYNRNQRELYERKDRAATAIGLTGGIGSGKTVATDALRDAGYRVIDADEISRELFAVGTDGERDILELFPQAEKCGKLDRAKLRVIISDDADARAKLNKLTHPRIIAEIQKLLAGSQQPVVLSAPLLYETSLSRLCDATVCVYCPRRLRIQRICARDGVTPSDAERIIDSQISDAERATLSDYIIPSDVPLEDFVKELLDLFDAITAGTDGDRDIKLEPDWE